MRPQKKSEFHPLIHVRKGSFISHFYSDEILLSSLDWLGTCFIFQTGLDLLIDPPASDSEHWDYRCVPLCPDASCFE